MRFNIAQRPSRTVAIAVALLLTRVATALAQPDDVADDIAAQRCVVEPASTKLLIGPHQSATVLLHPAAGRQSARVWVLGSSSSATADLDFFVFDADGVLVTSVSGPGDRALLQLRSGKATDNLFSVVICNVDAQANEVHLVEE